MKKTIIFLIAISFLMTVNLYAQTDGNLIVEGNAVIGSTTLSNYKLDVAGDIRATVSTPETDDPSGVKGIVISGNLLAGDFGYGFNGMDVGWRLKGMSTSANKTWQYASLFGERLFLLWGQDNVNDTYTIETGSEIKGMNFQSLALGSNSRDYDIKAIYSHMYSQFEGGNGAGGGNVHMDDFRHIYLAKQTNNGGFTMTNETGIWIDAMTKGNNRRGIVLDGDGAGSDIVFGDSQEARIYYNANDKGMHVVDGNGNDSVFSPHDPETGEWIFYSKNTKTGRTVRVNIEELVRDMEKLTGKKYLIESFTEKPQKSVD